MCDESAILAKERCSGEERCSGDRARALQWIEPVFLIAAAINVDGHLDVPAVRSKQVEEHVRIEVRPDDCGGFVQRRYVLDVEPHTRPRIAMRLGDYGSLDMLALAESLSYLYGNLTPQLFQLAEDGTSELREKGESADRARHGLLQDAFNAYLLAYEERLV